jgi:hypothetical protein
LTIEALVVDPQDSLVRELVAVHRDPDRALADEIGGVRGHPAQFVDHLQARAVVGAAVHPDAAVPGGQRPEEHAGRATPVGGRHGPNDGRDLAVVGVDPLEGAVGGDGGIGRGDPRIGHVLGPATAVPVTLLVPTGGVPPPPRRGCGHGRALLSARPSADRVDPPLRHAGAIGSQVKSEPPSTLRLAPVM